MADPAYKVPGQAPGAFYVDDNCIDCDLCRSLATLNFRRNSELGVSYLARQPQNPSERTQCQEALAKCPVEAIGDDGEG